MAARRAFTMIELLVATTVIGLLVALLVPAVQSTRESARRAQCASSLRQIGIAMHAYEAEHRMFPPGSANGFSPHVVLLPQLEQNELFSQINFATDDAAHTAVRFSVVSIYRCPSDSSSLAIDGPEGVDEGRSVGTATSYAGNLGAGVQRYGYNGLFRLRSEADPQDGLSPVRAADVTDGLSHTAAMSEILASNGSEHPLRAIRSTADLRAQPNQLDEFAATCAALPPSPLADRWSRGRPWTWGDAAITLYNHVLPPNAKSCINGTKTQLGAYSAGSLHPGFINTLLADGRVQRISENIDLRVWRAIGSADGSEP